MSTTPKQIVEQRFGTRSDLVGEILSLIDGDDETRARLMGTTNKKLLRIHEVATTVKERFGGKSGLLDAIEKLQFPKGGPNPGWREKVEGYTVKRLLDMHRTLEARARKTAG
ncbi:MAG: hypothetical protein ACQEXJ_02575 [Myxococcota bacterium]